MRPVHTSNNEQMPNNLLVSRWRSRKRRSPSTTTATTTGRRRRNGYCLDVRGVLVVSRKAILYLVAGLPKYAMGEGKEQYLTNAPCAHHTVVVNDMMCDTIAIWSCRRCWTSDIDHTKEHTIFYWSSFSWFTKKQPRNQSRSIHRRRRSWCSRGTVIFVATIVYIHRIGGT